MDLMGVDKQIAQQIIADELSMYQASRFRLTTRLRILNRVQADEQTRKVLETELEGLERIIDEYENELLVVG